MPSENQNVDKKLEWVKKKELCQNGLKNCLNSAPILYNFLGFNNEETIKHYQYCEQLYRVCVKPIYDQRFHN